MDLGAAPVSVQEQSSAVFVVFALRMSYGRLLCNRKVMLTQVVPLLHIRLIDPCVCVYCWFAAYVQHFSDQSVCVCVCLCVCVCACVTQALKASQNITSSS